MKVGISSDHGGFELKEAIKEKFSDIEWVDYGCQGTDSVDYPEFTQKLCKGILNNEVNSGIALCGSGIGASITANRFKGIRAALCHNEFTAEMCRRHNNANVLVMGGRVLENEQAFKMAQIFFDTDFEGGRHQRRLDAIEQVVGTSAD